MIAITLRPLPDSRTPHRPCRWQAEALIDGRRFEAVRRNGASYELARVLVAAGIADSPIEVVQDGIAGCLRWPSLHRMAGFTIREGEHVALRLARHQDMAAVFARSGDSGAISPFAVSDTGSGEMADKTPLPAAAA